MFNLKLSQRLYRLLIVMKGDNNSLFMQLEKVMLQKMTQFPIFTM